MVNGQPMVLINRAPLPLSGRRILEPLGILRSKLTQGGVTPWSTGLLNSITTSIVHRKFISPSPTPREETK